MKSGKLDRRLTIERFTTTRDEFNDPVETWATLAEVWASKEDVRDTERVAAQEVGAAITTRFQIRWSNDVADVNPKDRLVCEDKTYAIVAVKEIGRRRGLELSATARAD